MGEIRIIEISIDREPCFIKDGPVCSCGYHQWIIKPNSVVCSNCGEERKLSNRFYDSKKRFYFRRIIDLIKYLIPTFKGN